MSFPGWRASFFFSSYTVFHCVDIPQFIQGVFYIKAITSDAATNNLCVCIFVVGGVFSEYNFYKDCWSRR